MASGSARLRTRPAPATAAAATRDFTPVHPFVPAARNSPYMQPGYFLTPGAPLHQRRMPYKQWTHRGTPAHWLVLGLALLTVVALVYGLTTIQQPWAKDSHATTTIIERRAGSHTSNTHQLHLVDDIDVHQSLRQLVHVEATHETIDGVAVSWQRTNSRIQSAIASDPHLYTHVYGTDHHTANNNIGTDARERGLVLLLHGCSHHGSHWFTLPEERRIVRFLLSIGLSVLAITSNDRDSGCWDSTFTPVTGQPNVDVTNTLKAVQSFCAREFGDTDGKCPPLFTIGASSGGTFASLISRALPVVAAVIQISPGHEQALLTPSTRTPTNTDASTLTNSLDRFDALYPVPPLTFLYMHRDHHWASKARIESLAQRIKDSGRRLGARLIHSDAVIIKQLRSLEITKTFLSDRVDGVGVSVSESFFRACHRDDFIDRYNYLTENPRSNGMVKYIRELHSDNELGAAVRQHYDSIDEAMAVAWAEHELSSQHIDEIAWWFLRWLR